MNTRIIVDSTTDLIPAIRARVHVVPLTVHFGSEEYLDSVTIDHKTFYEKLVESDVLPTTSQASPAAFAEEYKKAQAAGDECLVITVASKFSGTCQSAIIAAQEYNNVYVVDSSTVAIGGGILVERALQLMDDGFDAASIARILEAEKKKIVIVALVNTLDYLKRGGRISKTVAFAGTVLGLKPVLSVIDGEIGVLGKARGSKQGNNQLVQEITKVGGVDFDRPVLLGYTGLSDVLLKKYIDDSRFLWEKSLDKVHYTTIGSVIGTHVGPGAIAVAFFRN